jgi:hypothetical protein
LPPQEDSAPRSLGTTRLEAFSDGVFAIAITLLVLDIALRPRRAHRSSKCFTRGLETLLSKRFTPDFKAAFDAPAKQRAPRPRRACICFAGDSSAQRVGVACTAKHGAARLPSVPLRRSGPVPRYR